MSTNLLLDPILLREYLAGLPDHYGWRTCKNRFKEILSPEHYAIFDCLDRLDSRSYRRSEKLDLEMTVHTMDLWEMWHRQDGKCAVTGIPLSIENGTTRHKNPWKVSIDRIDSDKGYNKDNVRLVTHWYNNAKNTWDDETCLTALKQWRLNESL